MDKRRKQFRLYLNQTYGVVKNCGWGKGGHYHATSRLYGDYLWAQDRVLFEVSFQEWIGAQEKLS